MTQNQDSQQLPTSSVERIILLFQSIHQVLREQLFERYKRFGFTAPQLALIFGLFKKPFSTLNEMSDCMGLSKSTVSGIVDRLVAQGVVIREIPQDNRRIVRLSLSQDFLNNNDLIELKQKYIADIIKNASEEDIEKIIAGLEKLYSLMKENK